MALTFSKITSDELAILTAGTRRAVTVNTEYVAMIESMVTVIDPATNESTRVVPVNVKIDLPPGYTNAAKTADKRAIQSSAGTLSLHVTFHTVKKLDTGSVWPLTIETFDPAVHGVKDTRAITAERVNIKRKINKIDPAWRLDAFTKTLNVKTVTNAQLQSHLDSISGKPATPADPATVPAVETPADPATPATVPAVETPATPATVPAPGGKRK